MTRETALAIWEELEPLDASVERIKVRARSDPSTYRVLVPTGGLDGQAISGVVREANSICPKDIPPPIRTVVIDNKVFLVVG